MKQLQQQKQLVLSQRLDKNNSKKIFVSNSCNPQTIDLIKTRTEPFGLELIIGNEKKI
jgi:glycine dehydrogenase